RHAPRGGTQAGVSRGVRGDRKELHRRLRREGSLPRGRMFDGGRSVPAAALEGGHRVSQGVRGGVGQALCQSRESGVTAHVIVAGGDVMRRAVMYIAIVCVAGAASVSAKDAKDKGEKVFADQKCALCHSVDGKGNKKGPLDEVGSKLSADDIREWITDAK